MESWQRNLYIISIAEFCVVLGATFVQPILPLFILKLGNFTTQQAAFWTGIALGGGGIAMFLSAPLWGILADRVGRKPMVLRAQIGIAISLLFLGFSPNIHFLVGFRILQGVLGGTVAAASALVATTTPRDKISFAMGIFMVSIYLGNTLGPLFGGLTASAFGFQASFFVGAGLLLLSGLAVYFYVKEDFVRPAPGRASTLRDIIRLAFSPEMLPILLVIIAINMAPQIVAPTIPLFITQLAEGNSVAIEAGLSFALIGLFAAISSYISIRIGKSIPLKLILIYCCLGSCLLYLPPIMANTVAMLVFLIGLTGLFTGGLLTSSNSLISLSVPTARLGIAYGLAQSANSLGSGLGPLIGGSLAPVIGIRYIFAVPAGLFLLVSILITVFMVNRR